MNKRTKALWMLIQLSSLQSFQILPQVVAESKRKDKIAFILTSTIHKQVLFGKKKSVLRYNSHTTNVSTSSVHFLQLFSVHTHSCSTITSKCLLTTQKSFQFQEDAGSAPSLIADTIHSKQAISLSILLTNHFYQNARGYLDASL